MVSTDVKSTAQVFGLFGNQKHSDSAELGLYMKQPKCY